MRQFARLSVAALAVVTIWLVATPARLGAG